MNTRYSVMADTHGHFNTVRHAISAELDHGNHVVMAGDFVDGPQTAELIQYMRSLGEHLIAIAGNHEWVLRNALANIGMRYSDWRLRIWPSYERGMLESYGLDRGWDIQKNAEHLLAEMSERGDWQWLETLPPYFATDEIVVVHAGPLPSQPWEHQQDTLDYIDQIDLRRLGEPVQLFSHGLAMLPELSPSVDARTFITGHAHMDAPLDQRIGPRRVRLATHLSRGAELLVWRTDESRIVAYPFEG